MRESVELVIRSIHLIAAIIWFGGRTLFYLHRNTNPAAKLVNRRPISSSQPFSDLDTIDDSCPPDDRRDGVLYRCME